jgi:hypothetical protein
MPQILDGATVILPSPQTWKAKLGIVGNGATGPQGPAGTTGATGATGATGPTGPAGPGQLLEYTGTDPTSDGILPADQNQPAVAYNRTGVNRMYGWNTVGHAWT